MGNRVTGAWGNTGISYRDGSIIVETQTPTDCEQQLVHFTGVVLDTGVLGTSLLQNVTYVEHTELSKNIMIDV